MTKNTEHDADYNVSRSDSRMDVDRLRDEYANKGDELGWFEALYQNADGDTAKLPWGHLSPRKELEEWLGMQSVTQLTGRALDIGCGLGDNAALLARSGFDVTACDISPTAVRWAARRFPELEINWVQANLLSAPPEFYQAFDMVNEVYTIQAMQPEYRCQVISAIADFVRPGGRLLVICRGRTEEDIYPSPPWPLLRSELAQFNDLGFVTKNFEEMFLTKEDTPMRHFRIEYLKA
jgi:SAM-dependent methyltransferase